MRLWTLFIALVLARTAASQELDWSAVARPGDVDRGGKLLASRLIVHFWPGQTPERDSSKSDGFVTNQPKLNALLARVDANRFERLFPVLAPDREDRQPSVRELVFVLDFDGDAHALGTVARDMEALPSVSRVEPDVYMRERHAFPNDPLFANQRWLRNPTQKDIRAVVGWPFATGDPSVIVAVTDSGVDWQHPDLGGTPDADYRDGVIWNNWAEINGSPLVDDDGNGRLDDTRGWDFVTGVVGQQDPPQDTQTQDNDPMDYGGHGTSVAGCVGAITDNGVGVAGTSRGCSIMPLRIGWTDPSGMGTGLTSFAAQAFDYARIAGAHIVNVSYQTFDAGGLGTAMDMAIAADMVIICAAGNENTNDTSFDSGNYGAARPDCMGVAAVDDDDVKASFSNYGFWVDISAPGVQTYTTSFDVTQAGDARHTYGSISGTSFSAPIVAGAAGIVKSLNPNFTQSDVRATLEAATDDLLDANPTLGGRLGTGRLNLAKLAPLPEQWQVPGWVRFEDALAYGEAGDEIRVENQHVLTNRLLLPSYDVLMSGGWNETYDSRNLGAGLSVIDATGTSGPAVLAGNASIGPGVVLDGFLITGGNASVVLGPPEPGHFGAGILVSGNASPTFRNCVVQGNTAGNFDEHGGGGGIAIIDASPTFEDVEVAGNAASQGAGVYVFRGAPTFRRVNVHDNTSYDQQTGLQPAGGGFFLLGNDAAKHGATITLEDCTVSGHDVDGSGGGIHAENVSLTMTGSTIDSNRAGGDGGGLYVRDSSYVGSNNVFTSNEIEPGAFQSGGGIFADNTSVDIDGARLLDNHADFSGGGMVISNSASPSVTNTLFARNVAGLVGAGMHFSATTGVTFTGNTVVANRNASQGGNGFFQGGGDGVVNNNIFAFNGEGGATLADGVACSGASLSFWCNLVFANDAGNYGGCPDPTGTNGNVEADPLFCDAGGDDYRLLRTSPAAAHRSEGCGLVGAGELCEDVAVHLAISATMDGADVLLRWHGDAVHDVSHYEIWRARVDESMVELGSIVSVREPKNYEYRDRGVAPGKYVYQVREISARGVAASGQVEVELAGSPTWQTALHRARPNPFNPTTSIEVELGDESQAELTVYDAQGRVVRPLAHWIRPTPGRYAITWNGTDAHDRRVASGVYWFRLSTTQNVMQSRVVLIK